MANTYLNRTLGTPTNNKKWTYSAWIKKSGFDGNQGILSSGADANNRGLIYFADNGKLFYYETTSGTDTTEIGTNRLFRDVSAWYHVVVAVDTTQATETNRVKIYVNGTQETSLSSSNYPSQDASNFINSAIRHDISGRNNHSTSDLYFNGYLSHVAFVDGQALAPTVFGETDSSSGIWKFKSPSGVTWGTNGFWLKFENSGALGTDSSGNSNTFTVNGNGRQALDTPSNSSATLNPLVTYGTNQNALTEGNNTLTGIAYHRPSPPTLAVNKGKWYFEAKALSGTATKWWIGLCDTEYDTFNQGGVSGSANYIWGYDNTTNAVNQRSQAIYDVNLRDGGGNISISNIFSAPSANDIYAMAVDLDNQKVWYAKNGVWNNGSASQSTTFNASYPDSTNIDANRFYSIGVGSENSKWSVNYGNGYFGTTAISSAGSNGNGSLFEYDVPSGFYALNTKNINTYG